MTQTFFMMLKTCKYRLTTKLFLEMPDDSDSGTTAQFRIGTEKTIMKFDDCSCWPLQFFYNFFFFFPEEYMAQFCVNLTLVVTIAVC